MPGMMEKGSDYLGKGRSNGTKSPSTASNGHFSDESGSDDEHGDIASNSFLPLPMSVFWIWLVKLNCFRGCCLCFPDVGMRVGADYQATIPDFEPGEFLLFSTWVVSRGSLGMCTVSDCTVLRSLPIR